MSDQDRGRCTNCGRSVPLGYLIEHTLEQRPEGFIGLCRKCGWVDPAPESMGWYLEKPDGKRTALYQFPFRVGRVPISGPSLTLASHAVSKQHAEFTVEDGALRVHDLGSKNGTFVNGECVETSGGLSEGDDLLFGDCELRLGRSGVGLGVGPRESVFWLGHLVGHLEEVQEETVSPTSSKRHGKFTPLGGPPSEEFMRLVDAKQRILKVNESELEEELFSFDSELREAWIVWRLLPQADEAPEQQAQVEWVDRHFEYLRRDVLDAIEQGLPEYACALTRELVSSARTHLWKARVRRLYLGLPGDSLL